VGRYYRTPAGIVLLGTRPEILGKRPPMTNEDGRAANSGSPAERIDPEASPSRLSAFTNWKVYLSLVIVCAIGGTLYRRLLQVEPLLLPVPVPPKAAIEQNGNTAIRYPGGVFATTVASFRDELFAYLMFQHYRSTETFRNDELLLCYIDNGGEPRYRVLLLLTDDVIESIARVAALLPAKGVENFDWTLLSKGRVDNYRRQARLFESAYNLPVKRKMESLTKPELRALVRRFIRFKSTTDLRVRKGIEPLPSILTSGDAHRLAGDIIAIAEFYELPLEFFLGIGAMENNYMNIRGDLNHTIWKARPAKDDIVVERRNGRVRVLNYASGVWQITRETLRMSHQLYLADKRNYGTLPKHLLPPRQLNVDEVNPEVLTTYAGLLLRHLLDHFDGDLSRAVGAYNGGPGNPNMRYHQGVEAAAMHARKVLEQAAALNGESVMSIRWLRAP